MIAVGTSLQMTFYFLYISNAFQSNIIHDPKKRHHFHILVLYMQWFKFRCPYHPLGKVHTPPDTNLVVQTIRGIQGTINAGAE